MKKANKRKLYVLGIVFSSVLIGLLLLFGLFVIADSILPLGSRSPEECYKFHITETTLIQKIHELKIANPEFVVPKEILGKVAPPGGDESYDTSYFIHYHYFYIYFKPKNQVFQFTSRSVPSLPTDESSIAFYAIDEEPFRYGNWEYVNQSLTGQKNKEVKKEFEENFLDKLGINYDKEGDSLPILTKYKDTPIFPLTISGIIVLIVTIVILAKSLKKNR